MAPRKKAPAGKAEAPENTPAATNGEADQNELERRRQAREAKSVSERVDATTSGNDDGDPDELFELGSLDGDPKVTLKTLVKANASIKAKASLGTVAVPIIGNGFFDPEQEVTFLVRGLPGGIHPVPTHGPERNGRHPIKEWAFTQKIEPRHIQHAGDMYTREQVLELFHEAGVAPAVVTRVLGDGPQAAQA